MLIRSYLSKYAFKWKKDADLESLVFYTTIHTFTKIVVRSYLAKNAFKWKKKADF